MAAAFVNTLKRDYVGRADLTDAETVIRQLPVWLDDYKQVAPHSALTQKSPRGWRAEKRPTSWV